MNKGQNSASRSLRKQVKIYFSQARGKPGRRITGTRPTLFALLLIIGLVNLGKQATCLQQQQQQQQQQHRSQDDQQQYLGHQNSLFSRGLSGDLGLTDESGENLNQQQQFGHFGEFYTSPSKRARKMTAFMPMRGRKDGRDEVENTGVAYFSELGDYEPSILRLVSSVGHNQDGPKGGQARLLRWPSNYYYTNQLVGKHSAPDSQPVASGLTSASAALGGRSGGLLVGDFGRSGQFMEQPALMQAKLRRAFHPMRGKKSAGLPVTETMLSPEQSTFADSDLNQMLLVADRI